MRGERRLRPLRPEPVAVPVAQSAGAAAALIGRRLRHLARDQPAHAGRRIEFRIAPQAQVDDDANAFDGQAGFGDARRQHDFSRAGGRRPERRILLGRREIAVQRQDPDVRARRGLLQGPLHPSDFRGARQKAQNVSRIALERAAHHLGGLQLERQLGAPRHVVGYDLIARPSAVTRGASRSSEESGCKSRVADMTSSRKSSRSVSWLSRQSASPRSALRLRS